MLEKRNICISRFEGQCSKVIINTTPKKLRIRCHDGHGYISVFFFQKAFQCYMFHNLFYCVQSNKDPLEIMSRSKGESWLVKIWKFVNLGAGNSRHWVRSMTKESGNFPFTHNNFLKQNYIIIFFGKHLSELYWNVLMCF